MKRKQPRAIDGETPPNELLRFRPAESPPIGPHGRPMPWAVQWQPEEFAAFLRARAAWRDTHTTPLPRLGSRDRYAMQHLGVPSPLVKAELSAPFPELEWKNRPGG